MSVRFEAAAADPAGTVAELRARVDAATAGILRTAAGISDEQARGASLLPGWTRGHVLTHVARNADGLANLLIWARTGVETPQYASQEARDAAIAAGQGRPAAELLADLSESAAAFARQAAALAGQDWLAEVHGLHGQPHPAWYTLRRRLTEVEIHHVDLDAGYRPADWPPEFAAEWLEQVAGDFADPESPAAVLRSSGTGNLYRIGPEGQAPTATITGTSHDLLAWLIGRSPGDRLATEPPGPLPSLPAW